MDKPIFIPMKDRLTIIEGRRVTHLKGPFWTPHSSRKLRNKSLVVGLIGARGSGKSVNGARLAILDQMLHGRRVWSNMDISFYVAGCNTCAPALIQSERYDRLQLTDLDTVYEDGCIFIDELNMDMADSRRPMATEVLMLGYIVQQLRKRKLNLIWTAQSEMHVDSRLRWQTDMFIKCTDISKPNGPGELTRLECFDMSGVLLGRSPGTQQEALFKTFSVSNKPWWNTYDTLQLQGVEKEVKEVDPRIKEIADKVESFLQDADSISTYHVWQAYEVFEDRGIQTAVALELKKRGIVTHGPRGKRSFIVDTDGVNPKELLGV